MKRWQAIFLWFAVLFLFNLVTQYNDGGYGVTYAALNAVGRMTSPVQLLLTVVAMVVIWKRVWQRKTLAERMQDKADRARLEGK